MLNKDNVIMEILEKLPKEHKKMIYFFIMDMKIIEKLADFLPLTKEEANKKYAEAIKDKNYFLATVFYYKSLKETQLNQGE